MKREVAPPARVGSRELALCLSALLVLGAVSYGSHVVHGGFYWDDWRNAATTRYSADGFLGPLDLRLLAYRPVLALGLPLPHLAFGANPGLHLALAVLLAVVTSACLYLLQRTLGAGAAPAAAIAALALLFPWSDSTRLWATGAINNVALILCLLALVASLHGQASSGLRRSRLRATAVALYVLSVLTYEIVALAALLTVLVHAHRSGWRAALRWCRVEALGIVAAATLVALTTTRATLSPAEQLDHARTIADQALTLLARAAVPFGAPPRAAVVALMLAVAAAALGALALRPGSPLAGELRRWLAASGASVIAIAAGYAVLVPGKLGYEPLSPGTGNRVNLLAGLGIVTLIFSLLMLAATLGLARSAARRRAATALALALSVVVAVGYAQRLDADKSQWDAAAATQRHVLAMIGRKLPDPPRGATIYTFAHPTFAARGVPAFAVAWDLNGAVKMVADDPSVRGYPLAPAVALDCEPTSLQPVGQASSRTQAAAYGHAYLLDVSGETLSRIASRDGCRRAASARERSLGITPSVSHSDDPDSRACPARTRWSCAGARDGRRSRGSSHPGARRSRPRRASKGSSARGRERSRAFARRAPTRRSRARPGGCRHGARGRRSNGGA